jgi:signal-transduction protein with cAMP-binding, CBS, and nucleotidyltransferase domain
MSKKVEAFISQQKLVSVQVGSTVADTLVEMGRGRVGTILVLKGTSLKGLLSERDLIRRVYRAGLSPETTPVSSVMTSKVATVRKSQDSKRCLALLRKYKCRSLPVISGWNQAVGVISIIDVLMDLTSELQSEQEEFLKMAGREGRVRFAPYEREHQLRTLVNRQKLRTLRPEDTVLEAVNLMGEANIGSVLIMDHGQLSGILSERDVLFKVGARGLHPRDVRVSDIMTKTVTSIDSSTTNLECLQAMKRIGCRHLPVTEAGQVAGVVSILDCLHWMFDEFNYYVEQWRTMALLQGGSGL